MQRRAAIADCCRHDWDALPDSLKEVVLRPDRQDRLRERVVRAAEAALAHHQYVSAVDVLTGAGLLAPTHVESWRKGRVDFLERVIRGKSQEDLAIDGDVPSVGAGEGSQAQPNPLRAPRAHRDGGPPVQPERSSCHREELLHSLCLAGSVRAQTTADHRKAESTRPTGGI